MAKIWVMTPNKLKIQEVIYDFKLNDRYFPNQHECKMYLINDINEYFAIFFDAQDGGEYNTSSRWIASYCGVQPTGNFVIMRKKWINKEEHTIDMDITVKSFKEQYLDKQK